MHGTTVKITYTVLLGISIDTATQMPNKRHNNNVSTSSKFGRSLAWEIHRQELHSSISASCKPTIWQPAQKFIYFEGNISVYTFLRSICITQSDTQFSWLIKLGRSPRSTLSLRLQRKYGISQSVYLIPVYKVQLIFMPIYFNEK